MEFVSPFRCDGCTNKLTLPGGVVGTVLLLNHVIWLVDVVALMESALVVE